ncbi:MAG: sulfurtransferase [Neisseria sp.]|nr:sulfurtransferase [Neisseria sp.]
MDTKQVLISPAELAQLQQTQAVVLIDTRDAEAYATGHIPEAVNLREIFTFLATSSPEGLQQMHQTFAAALGNVGISGKETVVFYEDTLNGGYGQSCRGYFLLSWMGYADVKVLNGGYAAWLAEQRPVSMATAVPLPAEFPAHLIRADIMVDKQAVFQALGTDTVLLDVRDTVEWIGESSSPYGADFAPRKGRLPGACWIEWYRFMKPSPQGSVLKSPSEVQAECDSAGIARNDEIILYCLGTSQKTENKAR